MTTHMKSECYYNGNTKFTEVAKHLVSSPCNNYRMWHEIVDKSKLHLLKLYMYLSIDKNALLKNGSITAPSGVDPNEFYAKQLTPQPIVDRWNCINDLYLENGFFGSD